MGKSFKQVYQFKVSLKSIRPPIWRRIQVPDYYTFWDLHAAIQDAMGWLDLHLHAFKMMNPQPLDGHLGEDRKAVHSIEYPGSGTRSIR